MKKTNKKLAEVLNIEPVLEPELIPAPVRVSSDVENDADFARENIRNLIDKGSRAMENLMDVARESEHPRAYEVLAAMMKNISDMNKDLMEIQKRKADLFPKEFKDNNSQINVDKAVFVGSTAELVKYLKTKKQEVN